MGRSAVSQTLEGLLGLLGVLSLDGLGDAFDSQFGLRADLGTIQLG